MTKQKIKERIARKIRIAEGATATPNHEHLKRHGQDLAFHEGRLHALREVAEMIKGI